MNINQERGLEMYDRMWRANPWLPTADHVLNATVEWGPEQIPTMTLSLMVELPTPGDDLDDED